MARRVTDKQKANLKPFKKGQSGNPKGMAKGTVHFSTLMREILNSELDDKQFDIIKELKNKFPAHFKKNEKVTTQKLLAFVQIKHALSDDPEIALKYQKEILDRTQGKATQTLEHTGKDGKPLVPNKFKVIIKKKD